MRKERDRCDVDVGDVTAAVDNGKTVIEALGTYICAKDISV